jgi:hypothetical protein
MKLLVDVTEEQGASLREYLNSDDGLRGLAALKLMAAKKQKRAQHFTNVVNGLGLISRAIVDALEHARAKKMGQGLNLRPRSR